MEVREILAEKYPTSCVDEDVSEYGNYEPAGGDRFLLFAYFVGFVAHLEAILWKGGGSIKVILRLIYYK